MADPVSRRTLLAGLAGAGLSLGAAAGPDHQGQQLEGVLRTLERAGDQLVDTAAGWADPPEPDVPAQAALLNSIRTEAAAILAIADNLSSRLRSE